MNVLVIEPLAAKFPALPLLSQAAPFLSLGSRTLPYPDSKLHFANVDLPHEPFSSRLAAQKVRGGCSFHMKREEPASLSHQGGLSYDECNL